MRICTCICLCLCFLLLGSFQAWGADRFISDILVVTLRDSPSSTSNIIGHLRSGDYMTILEEKENGYLYVRVSSGIEGWVPKKYTSVGKSKNSVIRDLKKTIVRLEEINTTQKSKYEDLRTQISDYQSSIDGNATREAKQQALILDFEKQVAEAQDKYITLKDQSQGVEAVFAEREILLKDNDTLTKELTVLKIENSELDQTRNIFWFLAGAAVFLVGCIIGRSGRKSRNRSSLSL